MERGAKSGTLIEWKRDRVGNWERVGGNERERETEREGCSGGALFAERSR